MTRLLACVLLLALAAPAQRLDLAPLKVSIPTTPFCEVVQMPNTKWYLHMVVPYGVPLVSIAGTTGTVQVKLNLEWWTVYGITGQATPAAVAAHFVPAILPPERVSSSLFVKTDGITWFGGAGIVPAMGTTCSAFGLATQALGTLVQPWPCDWDSHDALRCRDIVIDSAGIPRSYEHTQLSPWTCGVTVEVWLAILLQ